MRAPLLILASLSLAACATTAATPDTATIYRCDRSTLLTVSFEDGAALINDGGKRSIRLPQEPATTGFIYRTATQSLIGDEQRVLWKERPGPGLSCMLYREPRAR